jgi:WD40 repeat protein
MHFSHAPARIARLWAVAVFAALSAGAFAQSLDRPQPTPPAARVDAQGVPLPAGVVARLGSNRLRHVNGTGNGVEWLAVAPDGRTVASASRTDGIRVWDTATGQQLRQFPNPPATAAYAGQRLAFAADGRDLLCMSTEKASAFLRLDPATGQERLRVAQTDAVAWLRVAVSGRHFAYCRQEPNRRFTIHIADAATGQELRTINDIAVVPRALTFSPDEKTLAVTDMSDTIALYDSATGAKSGELKREQSRYTDVAFSPDGRTLGVDSTVREPQKPVETEIHLWDLATRQCRCQLQAKEEVYQFHFSPDGTMLATSGPRIEPIVWDTVAGREVRRFGGARAYRATFSADGKTLIGGTFGATVVFWDIASGRLLPHSADPVMGINDLRYLDGGRRLVGRADRLLAWDPATGREIERYADVPVVQGLVALSPDRRLLAGVDAGGTLRTWDAATGQAERALGEGETKCYGSPAFTPDGRRLIASASDLKPQRPIPDRVVVWDVATGQMLGTMRGPGGYMFYPAVSPDGRRLATFHPGEMTLRVWDLATYQEVQRVTPRSDGGHVAFSPDGRWLAAGTPRDLRPANSAGAVQLWDLDTGRPPRALTAPSDRPFTAGFYQPLAFSPDGRMLATGHHDGTLRLWEVATGGERHTFTGHAGQIGAVAFAPDGRTLAAASNEAPVYIWDVRGRSESPSPPLSVAELEQAWAAHAGADTQAAFQAIRRLVAAPEPAVAFLRERLKPAVAADAQRVRELVRRLDSQRFAERQQAAQELEALADLALAEMRAAIKDAPPLEVRLRLERLLDRVEAGTSEMLRAIRAVEAIEHIATPAARAHLTALAGGAPGATLTDAATAALKRLEK